MPEIEAAIKGIKWESLTPHKPAMYGVIHKFNSDNSQRSLSRASETLLQELLEGMNWTGLLYKNIDELQRWLNNLRYALNGPQSPKFRQTLTELIESMFSAQAEYRVGNVQVINFIERMRDFIDLK